MLLLSTSTALIFVSAILRAVRRPLNASLEISLFLFAWCVFLSADVGLREDRLIRLDMVTIRLPIKIQHLLSIVSYTLILGFLLYMARYGFELTYKSRIRTFQGIPDFSYAWVNISFPIASVLMSITTILKIRGFFKQLFSPDATPPYAGPKEEVPDLPVCDPPVTQ